MDLSSDPVRGLGPATFLAAFFAGAFLAAAFFTAVLVLPELISSGSGAVTGTMSGSGSAGGSGRISVT